MGGRSQVPRCQKMLKEACVNIFDPMGCEAAMAFCMAEINGPFFATGAQLSC